MSFYVTFIGAPGSGKGTQSDLLAKYLSVSKLGIGDILRTEIDKKSYIGKKALPFLSNGDLIPDNLVIELVKNSVSEKMLQFGFISDGFPRNFNQAIMFDAFLKPFPLTSLIFYINVSEDILLKRLLSRGRNDDKIEVIKNINKVYNDSVKEMLSYFENRIIYINGEKKEKEVFDEIINSINNIKVST